jgi:hypothetical protein
MLLGVAAGALLCAVPSAFSQTVQVSRQNRTVEVTVTQNVSVAAEIAEVTIGCEEYGATHEKAYQENLRVADAVVKALLAAGVPKENIKSSKLDLGENSSFDAESRVKTMVDRRFRAHQSWTIRVPAADAQKIIDVAVQTGANGVESVEWDVKRPEDLESKARSAALDKARQVAAEMAKNLGGKLGDALYASNAIIQSSEEYRDFETYTIAAKVMVAPPVPHYSLQLFPQKVEKSATVTVVFALD